MCPRRNSLNNTMQNGVRKNYPKLWSSFLDSVWNSPSITLSKNMALLTSTTRLCFARLNEFIGANSFFIWKNLSIRFSTHQKLSNRFRSNSMMELSRQKDTKRFIRFLPIIIGNLIFLMIRKNNHVRETWRKKWLRLLKMKRRKKWRDKVHKKLKVLTFIPIFTSILTQVPYNCHFSMKINRKVVV